jgi:predicted nucleic acid-binding Zn ribbon protein
MTNDSPPFTMDPKAHPSADSNLPPETERTLPNGRVCAGCGVTLTDRRPQARFCSARCRTEHNRRQRNSRLAQLVASFEATVTALKQELGGRDE